MVADGTSMTRGMEELVGVCDAWEWCCRGVGWQTSRGGQGSFQSIASCSFGSIPRDFRVMTCGFNLLVSSGI
ncbi:hypothetical protein V6Z12_A13G142500 [Gossypium hirsutum]